MRYYINRLFVVYIYCCWMDHWCSQKIDVPVAHVVVMTKKLQEDASIIPVCPLKHLFIFLPEMKPSDFGKTKPFYHHTFFLLIIVFFWQPVSVIMYLCFCSNFFLLPFPKEITNMLFILQKKLHHKMLSKKYYCWQQCWAVQAGCWWLALRSTLLQSCLCVENACTFFPWLDHPVSLEKDYLIEWSAIMSKSMNRSS